MSSKLRSVLIWGTFDEGKPRVRILERGLKENDIEVYRCHTKVWDGIEDKSQISGLLKRLQFLFRWLTAYPGLIYRLFRAPKTDVILVSYMGHLDVIVLWLFAKIKGTPIVWDAFLSLYNTVVEDRKILGRNNPLAWILWLWEWLACRAANLVLLDTKAHSSYFLNTYKLKDKRVSSVIVGVEPEYFPHSLAKMPDSEIPIVLFYGQLIPLHGIDTILSAVTLTHNNPVKWIIIGTGQDSELVEAYVRENQTDKLQWIPWVEYSKLESYITQATICLGIFGNSNKANMVIPNKVFQMLACNKSIITRDSDAIKELKDKHIRNLLTLIEADNPEELAKSILNKLNDPANRNQQPDSLTSLLPITIGKQLATIVEQRLL